MPKSERPAKRKIRLVGGGFRWNRVAHARTGGSMKSRRRQLLKLAKSKGRNYLKAQRAANKAQRNIGV